IEGGNIVAALEGAVGGVRHLAEPGGVDFLDRRRVHGIGAGARFLAVCRRGRLFRRQSCYGNGAQCESESQRDVSKTFRHLQPSNRGALASRIEFARRTASAGSRPGANTAEDRATNSAPVAATVSTESISEPPRTMQGSAIISDHQAPSPRLRGCGSG